MWKIVDVDTGFCRIVYRATNAAGDSVFYCLQDEGERFGGVRLMRCSSDYEPSHEVSLKAGVLASDLMPLPDGESELERNCRAWILAHSAEG